VNDPIEVGHTWIEESSGEAWSVYRLDYVFGALLLTISRGPLKQQIPEGRFRANFKPLNTPTCGAQRRAVEWGYKWVEPSE
jgi:hypothetical protein